MVAEAFPPGDLLKEELEARNWTQTDLAKILGKSVRLVNEVVNGRRAITPDTAKGFAGAFGTSANLWLNLESAWQLFQLKGADDDVPRRARLYQKFPVKEMIRRGWIQESSSLDVLEGRFCEFFRIKSVDETPALAGSFRRTNEEESVTYLQLAWLYRAYQLASAIQVPKFTTKKLEECLAQLKALTGEPEAVRHVPRTLNESGIRFVIVEPFAGSKIDGVCFWYNDAPVVAISLRYNRIDYFWFTLMHELRHAANGDGKKDNPIVDVDIECREPDTESEKRANEEAAGFLIPEHLLTDFIARVSPLYSFKKVSGFAIRNLVHPGLVVGQLQHRGEIPYSNFRKFLVDVREFVLPGALTDGWGYSPVVE